MVIKKIKAIKVPTAKPKVKAKPKGNIGLHQTGTSNIFYDTKRDAIKPGYRISASGKKYYEARRNRSDKRGSKI